MATITDIPDWYVILVLFLPKKLLILHYIIGVFQKLACLIHLQIRQ